MVICTYCAKENDASSVFCVRCQRLLAVHEMGVNTTMRSNELPSFIPRQGQIPKHVAHIGCLGDHRVALYVGDCADLMLFDVKDRCTLGRASTNGSDQMEINLSPFSAFEKGVSRIHAALLWQNDDLMVEDLGSSNGTWVSSVRLEPHKPQPIQSGDMVLLGKLDVWVYYK